MQSLFDIGINKQNILDILDYKQSYIDINNIAVDKNIIGNSFTTLSIEIKINTGELYEILNISNLKQRLLCE